MGTHIPRSLVASLALALACGMALGAGSWVNPADTLATSSHITAVGQVRTGALNVTVQHDTTCTIAVSGSPVLTNGASTLPTAYKLTGPITVTNQDAAWVGAADFITHTYGITSVGPQTTLNLEVQATPLPNAAPPAGVYSATIILTVSW